MADTPSDPPDGPLSPELQALVTEHMDLVEAAARQEHRRRPVLSVDELRSIGFLKMVELAAFYDPGQGTFGAFVAKWIRGVMRHATHEAAPEAARRQSWLEMAQVDRDPDGPPTVDRLRDPTTTLDSKFVREQLGRVAREMIDELSPDNRALVQALYIEGLTLSAHARNIGKSPATVMRQRDAVVPLLIARMFRVVREG